jgi:hypothetical protein
MNDKVAAKLDRLEKAVRGTGLPDRIPVGDNFWTGYLLRERALRGPDFDPYLFHDLDYVIVTPNMDPKIQPFEVLEDDGVTSGSRPASAPPSAGAAPRRCPISTRSR